jgi:cytochrome P450
MNSHTTVVPPALGNPPPQVPPHLVFDFDIYNDPRIGSDVQGTYAQALNDAPDVFWTTKNGGHWIIKSFDAISAIVTDFEHFSVQEMQIPRVENPPFFIPLSLDPPRNLPYRRAMMPMFGPSAIKALEPRIRDWAQMFVDRVADQGRCDFQLDVSKAFPVSVFMELMGMDLSRLQSFRELAEGFFDNQDNAEEMGRMSGLILGEMKALIDEKRAKPDGKLMSHFIEVDIDGRNMTDDEILAMAFVLFLGGMDTVTNLTGFAYQQLAQMPDLQAQLAADPSLIGAFTDEAIRLYGVINTPRLVVQEQTIGEAVFRPGEMVLCILCVGSRDPAKFDAPNAFNLNRKRTTHLTFSSGPHLCIGHVLGRTEIRILTEEWIKRIPSFRAAPGERRGFRTGTVMALESLPIEWSAA